MQLLGQFHSKVAVLGGTDTSGQQEGLGCRGESARLLQAFRPWCMVLRLEMRQGDLDRCCSLFPLLQLFSHSEPQISDK